MTRKRLARSDVVLTRFPFTDLTGASLRPAIVISEGEIGNDVVLAAVSRVVRGGRVATDLSVPKKHPEFVLSGLRLTSVIRAHKLVTIERSLVVRRIGRVGPRLQEKLNELLRRVLSLQ